MDKKNENVVQLIFHLPQVRMVGMEYVDIGLGEIQNFSFDEWYSLETPGVVDWQRDYEYGKPAFFFIQQNLESTPYDQSDPKRPVPTLKILVDLVWLSLVTTFGQAVPHPDLSLQYTRILYKEDGESGTRDLVYPYIGYCEYDLLKGSFNEFFELGKNESDDLKHNLIIMAKIHRAGWFKTFVRLYEPVLLLANIKINPTDALVHLVRCFENLTNPDAQRPLGQQFALRFAIMTSPAPENFEKQRALGQLLWRFRTNFIHGQDYQKSIDTLIKQYHDLHKILFQPLLVCASRLATLICNNLEQPPKLTDIIHRLDRLCANNTVEQEDLIQFFNESGTVIFKSKHSFAQSKK